ncbi:hypothetical protein CesoFtcFv8_008200 [Champsocephalus esox]|uniref:Uncharacterized protein n=1 Tax=Champsocephalus esox TaxID=159716 RepID=A0AAN8H1C1_9TELE|nr:hypothetical protein CesoFtcFv8_008200 [Champsocephalus esox]
MTAGAVSAPLIIPIMHLHTHRTKNHVDTHTPVSMHSDTPSSQIFFSLDGSKPEAEPRGGQHEVHRAAPVACWEGDGQSDGCHQ